jgi:hypothetical protein
MKVKTSIDLTDFERRAIGSLFGDPGSASRERCHAWFGMTLRASLEVCVHEYEAKVDHESRVFGPHCAPGPASNAVSDFCNRPKRGGT